MIEDAESSATHGDWDAATQCIHLDEDSLYVAVQSVVDGPVTVRIYRGDIPEEALTGMTDLFSGAFESGSGKLRVQDSVQRAVLTVTVNRGLIDISVFVDEVDWASQVAVLFR
ncbi:hypothetical protein CAG99_10290 [Streptomyces marincola]|uniref:Uncharacterized protein n=1 Tax=Streptomyces marincola TaxID=2878388 RepID=A0A1W7CXY7_9ACTN|nr:hypothetical protein CAG99_10290 [Streptomyces marincola]